MQSAGEAEGQGEREKEKRHRRVEREVERDRERERAREMHFLARKEERAGVCVCVGGRGLACPHQGRQKEGPTYEDNKRGGGYRPHLLVHLGGQGALDLIEINVRQELVLGPSRVDSLDDPISSVDHDLW